MIAYSTQDGFVYWGNDMVEIVTKMRRAAFFSRFASNKAFMKSVIKRMQDGLNVTFSPDITETEFVTKLVEAEVLADVGQQFECPIINIFCENRRESCEQGCWLKTERRDGT